MIGRKDRFVVFWTFRVGLAMIESKVMPELMRKNVVTLKRPTYEKLIPGHACLATTWAIFNDKQIIVLLWIIALYTGRFFSVQINLRISWIRLSKPGRNCRPFKSQFSH
ncbi:hypothetical protein D3C87_1824700 [compost metagenome]